MRPYFEKMTDLGKPLTEQQIKKAEENVKQIREVEKIIAGAVEKVKKAGLSGEEINKRGEMTVYQRLEYLLDPGTWCPYIPSSIQWMKSQEQPAWLMDWVESVGNGR